MCLWRIPVRQTRLRTRRPDRRRSNNWWRQSGTSSSLAFSVLQNTGVYIFKNCFWRFLEKMKNMTWMLSLFILFHTFPEKSFSSPKTYFFPKKNSLCSPIQRINPSLCSPIQQINPSLCSPIQRINPSLCSPIQRINP